MSGESVEALKQRIAELEQKLGMAEKNRELYAEMYYDKCKELRRCGEERIAYQKWVVAGLDEQKQRIIELEDQNQALIEALEFYANANYACGSEMDGCLDSSEDAGEKARQSLQSIRKNVD